MVKNTEKRTKKFVTEQYYKTLINKLTKQIPKNKYRTLFGIPRGGMVIAVYLSHRLNLPIVDKT